MTIPGVRHIRDCAAAGFAHLFPVLLIFSIGGISSVSAQEGPDAGIKPPSWDFGYLVQKSEVSHLFHLHNGGTAPLTVSKIKAGCSCTSVSKIEEPVAPGDSAEIIVTFKSGRYHGHVKKTTDVHTDDPEDPVIKLQITANVVKQGEPTGDVAVEPQKLKWKAGTGRVSVDTDTLTIVNNGANVLTASVLHAPHLVTAAVDLPETVGPGETSKILLHVSDEPKTKDSKGLSVTFAFAGRDTSIITIPIEIED